MIMLVTVLLVLAWRRFDQEPPSRTARFWFVAGCIAIGQLHYYAIVIPAVLALLSVTRPHRAVVLTGATLSAVFVAVILAVKQAAGALSLEAGYLVTFTPGAAIELFGYWFPLGRMVGLTPGETALAMTTGWIVVIVSTTAMLAWIIAGWRSARRDYWLAHVLLLLAVPGVLTVLLLARREAYYVPRSALPSLPFYVLAVAAAIQLVRHDMARRATIAVTVLASALVFVYLNARRDRSTVSTPNPEWRGIIDPVLALREASGRQLVVFSTTPIRELLYYLPGAGECEWPLDGEGKRDVTGPRARLARTFPTTARPSCGPDGTASIRLYVVDDSTLEWIDSVRTHEAHARPLLLLNEFWEGKTRGVIRALHANGQPLRSIARAKSLEVFEMGPNQ
jgi:hypothetical protein